MTVPVTGPIWFQNGWSKASCRAKAALSLGNPCDSQRPSRNANCVSQFADGPPNQTVIEVAVTNHQALAFLASVLAATLAVRADCIKSVRSVPSELRHGAHLGRLPG
jgi:hypothetical protein